MLFVFKGQNPQRKCTVQSSPYVHAQAQWHNGACIRDKERYSTGAFSSARVRCLHGDRTTLFLRRATTILEWPPRHQKRAARAISSKHPPGIHNMYHMQMCIMLYRISGFTTILVSLSIYSIRHSLVYTCIYPHTNTLAYNKTAGVHVCTPSVD